MKKNSSLVKDRHFVLVHGAGHGAWCWYEVATLLQSADHTVMALDLGAQGLTQNRLQCQCRFEAEDLGSMMDYVEPLFEIMGVLPAQEMAVLVGHSMGRGAVAMAMERFPEKIAVAVFAAAMMPGPDHGFVDLLKEYARRIKNPHTSKYKFDDGPDKLPTSSTMDYDLPTSKLYQLSPPEDLTLATDLLRPTRSYPDESVLLEQTAVTKERYGSVCPVFIMSDRALAYTEDMQRWMIEETPPDEVKVISGSDHMVMFSKPEELCSQLQEIAQSYT